MSIRSKIIAIIAKAVPKGTEIDVRPAEEHQGVHYATTIAFALAKVGKNNPREVAAHIAEAIAKKAPKGFFETVEVAGSGFINLTLSKKTIRKEFAAMISSNGRWQRPEDGKKRTIVIDYSHPNIAKPMSIAHIRSTIIGQALYNIFTFAGWKAIGDNHLGDWGKQFGILIAAFKMSGLKNESALSIDELMELYVDYTAKMKEDPALEERAREEVKRLQDGNEENMRIWKVFYKVSLDEFEKIYKILGVTFDYYLGESFYNNELPGVVRNALREGVAKKSDGAIVIFTHEDKTPFIIQKSDGSYLYATTDLAAIGYRVKKFKADLAMYVVDNGQSFYFEQLFKAAEMLKLAPKTDLVHVKFGLFLAEDMKKFSTRAGRHVSLEKLIEEAIVRARKIVEEKNPELNENEKERIARTVGVGALKYNDLSQNRLSNIAFNWDKMLNFEGNSAPYLQYTYTRLMSILKKAEAGKFDPAFLTEPIEEKLIVNLFEFPETIEEITHSYYPNHLTDYLYALAKDANYFYQTLPVLKADEKVRNARLALLGVVADTLKNGLELLGIEVAERM